MDRIKSSIICRDSSGPNARVNNFFAKSTPPWLAYRPGHGHLIILIQNLLGLLARKRTQPGHFLRQPVNLFPG